MRRQALILGLLSAVMGCAKAAPVSVFGGCEQDGDCESGTFCAQGGPLAGHCAYSCTEDTECSSRYGAAHACVDSVCVQVCGRVADCSAAEGANFEVCAAGLSCRTGDSDQCASSCAISSWGTARSPGVSAESDPGGALGGGGSPGPEVDGGTAGGGAIGGGAAKDAGATLDGAAIPGGDAASADGAAGNPTVGADAGTGPSSTCPGLPVVTDYTAPGPFDVKMFEGVGPDNKYTLFRPDTTLGQGGFEHPIAAWGHAGYENVGPEDYATFLGFVTSHGFVVIACNDRLVDRASVEAGLDWLVEQNTAGPLAGKLDVTREIVFGQNWGGEKALEAARRDNVKAAIMLHALQPEVAAAGSLRVPLLMVASSRDMSVFLNGTSSIYTDPELTPIFGAIVDDESVGGSLLLDEREACFGTLPCPGYGGEVQRGPVVAWMRFWACGDETARALFYGTDCALCRAPWKEPLRNPAMLK